MGYDSHRFIKVRPILKKERNYWKPLMTPDGSKVVFSDITKKKVYVVDWSGKNKETLSTGVALEVWKDPVTHRVWVYVLDGPKADASKHSNNPLYRFPMDEPSARERVWDKTRLTWDNVQLSADGKRASGLFPWPNGGVMNLETDTWERYGRGCWTSFSPDNQYLLWIFDGPHRNIMIYHPDGKTRHKVTINKAEDIDGYEVYHPRWSNHPRYLVMTGPYVEGEGGNRIRGGGERVEVYAGRFNDTFTEVDQWVKISRNKKGDFYPDLWIDEQVDTEAVAVAGQESDQTDPAPPSERLIVQATCTEAYTIPDPRNIGMYDRALAVHHYQVNHVEQGTCKDQIIYVAQWLIKDKKLILPAVKVGQKQRFELDNFYDHPDLEGDRLLMGPTVDVEADLYIDARQLAPK